MLATENIKMVNKHMKKILSVIVTRELQYWKQPGYTSVVEWVKNFGTSIQ
jgi:hypothetical protein